MALGYRLSGPRMDGVLAPAVPRPAKARAGFFGRRRSRGRVSTISVTVRRDGAVSIRSDASQEGVENNRTPVIFRFRASDAAEAVMAGAQRRLAGERMDESGLWYLHLSAGQAAAAIKTEAKGLSCSFAVIHPYLADAPIVGSAERDWSSRTARLASYAIVMSAGVLVGLVIGLMLKAS